MDSSHRTVELARLDLQLFHLYLRSVPCALTSTRRFGRKKSLAAWSLPSQATWLALPYPTTLNSALHLNV